METHKVPQLRLIYKLGLMWDEDIISKRTYVSMTDDVNFMAKMIEEIKDTLVEPKEVNIETCTWTHEGQTYGNGFIPECIQSPVSFFKRYKYCPYCGKMIILEEVE